MEKKSFLNRFIGHFTTITSHKILVTKLCFKCGLYKQGILHDLSKYTPTEFFAGVKYYQGYRSPIDAEKEELGYSEAWLHHKGRNKHHWEYWVDKFPFRNDLSTLEMPQNYLIESILDKIAASKIYRKENYTDADALNYLMNGTARFVMHEKTTKDTIELLTYLKDHGEEKALKHYKELYKDYKRKKKSS